MYLALRAEGEQRLGAKRLGVLSALSVATVAQWQQMLYVLGAVHSIAPTNTEYRPMTMTAIYHVSRIDDNGEWEMLEGFVGEASEAYGRADARLDYWWNKYPNAVIDILRKA